MVANFPPIRSYFPFHRGSAQRNSIPGSWTRRRHFIRLARTCSVYPGRPRGRLVCGVGVPAKACRNFVAEGNCVAVRRGGEQPEANRRSEGARTRFGANPWRACWVRAKPGTTAGAETTVESDHRTACVVGVGTTGRRGGVSGETRRSGEGDGGQNLHSTAAAGAARGAGSKTASREGR